MTDRKFAHNAPTQLYPKRSCPCRMARSDHLGAVWLPVPVSSGGGGDWGNAPAGNRRYGITSHILVAAGHDSSCVPPAERAGVPGDIASDRASAAARLVRLVACSWLGVVHRWLGDVADRKPACHALCHHGVCTAKMGDRSALSNSRLIAKNLAKICMHCAQLCDRAHAFARKCLAGCETPGDQPSKPTLGARAQNRHIRLAAAQDSPTTSPNHSPTAP